MTDATIISDPEPTTPANAEGEPSTGEINRFLGAFGTNPVPVTGGASKGSTAPADTVAAPPAVSQEIDRGLRIHVATQRSRMTQTDHAWRKAVHSVRRALRAKELIRVVDGWAWACEH